MGAGGRARRARRARRRPRDLAGRARVADRPAGVPGGRGAPAARAAAVRGRGAARPPVRLPAVRGGGVRAAGAPAVAGAQGRLDAGEPRVAGLRGAPVCAEPGDGAGARDGRGDGGGRRAGDVAGPGADHPVPRADQHRAAGTGGRGPAGTPGQPLAGRGGRRGRRAQADAPGLRRLPAAHRPGAGRRDRDGRLPDRGRAGLRSSHPPTRSPTGYGGPSPPPIASPPSRPSRTTRSTACSPARWAQAPAPGGPTSRARPESSRPRWCWRSAPTARARTCWASRCAACARRPSRPSRGRTTGSGSCHCWCCSRRGPSAGRGRRLRSPRSGRSSWRTSRSSRRCPAAQVGPIPSTGLDSAPPGRLPRAVPRRARWAVWSHERSASGLHSAVAGAAGRARAAADGLRAARRPVPSRRVGSAPPRPCAPTVRGSRLVSPAMAPREHPLAWLEPHAGRRRAAGLRRELRPRPAGDPLLDLAGNDYLGLATDPRVVAGAVAAARTWGAGSTGSRLVTGTHRAARRAGARARRVRRRRGRARVLLRLRRQPRRADRAVRPGHAGRVRRGQPRLARRRLPAVARPRRGGAARRRPRRRRRARRPDRGAGARRHRQREQRRRRPRAAGGGCTRSAGRAARCWWSTRRTGSGVRGPGGRGLLAGARAGRRRTTWSPP